MSGDEEIQQAIMRFQRNEITEHIVYKRLAERAKGRNAEVLKSISDDELRYYNEWKMFTEILLISLGIAAISFLIGWLARGVLQIEI